MSESVEIETPKPLGLTPKQIKYLGLLHEFKTHSECAVLVGANRKTLYRWRHKKLFQQLSEKISQDVMRSVIEKRVEAFSC